MTKTPGRRNWIVLTALLALSFGYAPRAWCSGVVLAWDSNPAAESVTGYVLYYGLTSRTAAGFVAYDRQIDVGNVTTYVFDSPFGASTTYVALAAYSKNGLRSGYSAELVINPATSPPTDPSTNPAPPPVSITYFSLGASAGSNGSITPSGTLVVRQGGVQSFAVTPAAGYRVADVLVDGKSVGAVTSYSFGPIAAPHTISASFSVAPAATCSIAASAGSSGSIKPAGTVKVMRGATQAFLITPDSGYRVSDVTVDGKSVGPVTTYGFGNVVANHTIKATFTPQTTTYRITTDSGSNGTISPGGTSTVPKGSSKTFDIVPSLNYRVSDVVIDGQSVGPVYSYAFTNVTTSHTISASFSNTGVDERFTPFSFGPLCGVVTSQSPSLVVQNALAAENLLLEFQIATDGAMSRIVYFGARLPERTSAFSSLLPSGLSNRQVYYWRARATNGKITSPWTEPVSFRIDTGAKATTIQPEFAAYLLAGAENVYEVTGPASETKGVLVDVPTGALKYDTLLTVSSVHNLDGVAGKAFFLGPQGLAFQKPVTIRIPYSDQDLTSAGVSDPKYLAVYRLNLQELFWEKMPLVAVDYSGKRLVCNVDGFSLFTVARQ